MAIQTNPLESKLDSLEQKAEEYDTRTNTERRVKQAETDLNELNRALRKLKDSAAEFEQQAGILTDVFEEPLPDEVVNARNNVRSITSVTQDNLLDIVDDSSRSLSSHTDEVRETREDVTEARRTVDERLKKIQRNKLDDANTAESIQKIIGEDPDAMKTIRQYRSFLNSILNPNGSVSQLKSQWQGLGKAFENLDTDWEGFRQHHNLSQQTIDDLKKLSQEDELSLDYLSNETLEEMLTVSKLRSNIKVSL